MALHADDYARSQISPQAGFAAQAVIDLAALDANFQTATQLAGGRALLAVVKADAYGHGAVAVVQRLLARGCAHFAVATLGEAAELRAAGVRAPLLVFAGAQNAAQADAACALGATLALHDAAALARLRARAKAAGCTLPVHVEVDTGMRRMGVPAADAPALIEAAARARELALEGVYTHLACADERDLTHTRAQLKSFARTLEAARVRGVTPKLVHVANSAALFAQRELEDALPAQVNAARPGLMLYGAAPSQERSGRAQLAPVMSLHTRICALREVRAGESVGYGAQFRARAPGRVATLPIGYADGLPWSAAGRAEFLLRGKRVRVAGRVSMDLTSLDIGASAAAVGDPVLLFGADENGARLPVEALAACCETIPYEVLVRAGRRVPRVCVG